MKSTDSPTYHPSPEDIEHLQKAKRRFLFVGLLLFVFTGTTVAVATVPWLDFGAHGFDTADAVLGLAIATVKASLVAIVFMHLNHEKKAIYWIFGLGMIHAAGFYFGTYMHFADMIHDRFFYSTDPTVMEGDMGTDLHEVRPGAP